MRSWIRIVLILLILVGVPPLAVACGDGTPGSQAAEPADITTIDLPEPRTTGNVSLEESLLGRRSVRDYTGEPVELAELSQLLWAAQGITNEEGHRTAPSAGGLYPLELYIVSGDVADLEPGIYLYRPADHDLFLISQGDRREELMTAALDQEWVGEGALTFVITAVYERTTEKYGDRGIRYVHMESGHAAQNICLQAAALGLGTVTIGAFHEDQIVSLLGLAEGESPLYVMPVGRR